MNKSREIKFRAWDKETNVMLTPDFIVNGGGEVGDYPRGYWDDGPDFYKDIVLMQYTGLKDKNGKEIYEGDIILNYDKYNSVVKWAVGEDSEAQNDVAGFWFDYEPDDLEVIGNIYENPELLEGK